MSDACLHDITQVRVLNKKAGAANATVFILQKNRAPIKNYPLAPDSYHKFFSA